MFLLLCCGIWLWFGQWHWLWKWFWCCCWGILFFCFLASRYYSGTCSILLVVKPKSLRIPSSKLYTTPCICRFFPWTQACWTAATLETLITCCLMLSSTRVCYFFSWFPSKDYLNLLRSSRIWLNQDYSGPKSFCLNAALIPPHL